MRLLPVAALALAALGSCGSDEQRYVPNMGDGTTVPTMATSDVETLISDSGYTRYKVVAPLWQMFEDCENPYWRFPEGLFLEQYDLDMRPESHVECDSAIYFSRERLWRLDGTVTMVNTLRDSFLTQQLYWNQITKKMYSDSFIHIVRSDRIIEGYGFESDQSMTSYTVHRPTAILPVERNARADTASPAATTTDTAAANTAAADTAPAARRTPRTHPSGRIRLSDNEPSRSISH